MEVFSVTGPVKTSVACLHNTLILLKMVIEKKYIHVCSLVPLVVTKNVFMRHNIPNLCCHLDLLHTLPFAICFSYAFFYMTP